MQDMLAPLPYSPHTEIREDLSTTSRLPNMNDIIKEVMVKVGEGDASLSDQSSLPHQGLHSTPTLRREGGPMVAVIDWALGHEFQSPGLSQYPKQGGKDYVYFLVAIPADQIPQATERIFNQWIPSEDPDSQLQSLPVYDNEEAWARILPTLEDKRWDFRTVAGIAHETGIDAGIVQHLLEQHEEDVRKSPDWGNPGQFLYTRKSRRMTIREILADMQFFITGKSG